MKKHMRLFSVLLSAAMIVSLAAGCSRSSSQASGVPAESGGVSSGSGEPAMEGNMYLEGTPVVKEKETYTIAVSKHTLDKSESYNDKIGIQMVEEATNVHIEWIEVVSGTADEKIPIMLASDLPDAFLGLLNETYVSKNTGSFVVLNDLVSTYCPNIVEQYNAVEDMRDMLKFPDGNIYTFATDAQISPDNDGGPMFFMNTKWLSNVGMEMPATTDELYDVLKAFKEKDANGNGDPGDEIPLETCENNWAAMIQYYSGPWGFIGNYKIENGKFIPAINTQAYRDFLEYFHKLAAEGLMDVEGFSQTNQQFYAKLKEYICGSYSGWTPQSNFDSETAKEYSMVMPLTAPGYEGQEIHTGYWQEFRGNRTGFAVTTACKNPKVLLRWWDYMHSSTELKWTLAYGEEGKIWERDGSGKVWTIYPETEADYTRENMKYTEGMWTCEPLILAGEWENNNGDEYPDSVLRYNMTVACRDYYQTEILPKRFVAEEKTAERALIETDLLSYLNTFRANSIINGVTDASWEEHLKQLEALNLEGWVQWYQDFIDGKF